MNPLLGRLWAHSQTQGAAGALRTPTVALCWGELWQRVETAAEIIGAQGIQRLGLLAANGADWIVADLAAQRAGVPLIPLPGFFTADQLAHVCTHAGVDWIATDAAAQAAALGYREGPSLGALSLCRGAPTGAPPLHPGTAKITFTSGTTGAPKGVCLSQASQHRTAAALAERLAALPSRRHLCALPLAVLLENLAGAWSTLLIGGELILLPGEELGLRGSSQFDAGQLASAIDRYRVESVILLPQMLQALVHRCAESRQRLPSPALPSLKIVAVGGSRVAPELLDEARELGLPVVEGYGLSECASVVCLNPPGQTRRGSVGKPLPHWRVEMAGDGEILVAGDGFLGYLGEAAHTGPIATGDLGAVDDAGFVSIQGRKKNLLISSYGRNISPEWPESELCRQAVIAQALVFGDDRPWCGALLVPRAGADAAAIAAAVANANARLPDYARIHHWLLAAPFAPARGELTANGRLKRDRILDRYRTAIAALYQSVTDAHPAAEPSRDSAARDSGA